MNLQKLGINKQKAYEWGNSRKRYCRIAHSPILCRALNNEYFGSEYYPLTAEGRGLAFLVALFGYAVFGYVTATLATFFIGRDAEEKDAPLAGAKNVAELKSEIAILTKAINDMKNKLGNSI